MSPFSSSQRIVLATMGSLGDLHPYLALGLELQRRGHRPVIASSDNYRSKVEATGLEFHAVPPSLDDFGDEAELLRKCTNLKNGSEYVIREAMLPFLREAHAATLAIARGADLLVSHPITFAVPIVADQLQLRWVSSVLAPLSFFSKYDPPVLPPMPWLRHLRRLGPTFCGWLNRQIKHKVRDWMNPVRQLRQELGLAPPAGDPLFEGQFSPYGTLAFFSPIFGPPQPDWPTNTLAPGFPTYDPEEHAAEMPAEITDFLAQGAAPLVFTLGSAAVMNAENFFRESALAAQKMKMRAILLVGRDERNLPAWPLSPEVLVARYAPYSQLFPQAAAIVHQGGVGTTAQALRSGKPMIVMPFSHDQPDNADRVRRLGVGKEIPRRQYTARRAAADLTRLLADKPLVARAQALGKMISQERGVEAACDFLEKI